MSAEHLHWWSNLYHGGMLLDAERLSTLIPALPDPLTEYQQDQFRRELIAFQNEPLERRSSFVAYVLENVCGFAKNDGKWLRGTGVPSDWTRYGLTGEAIRPSHLWLGPNEAVLPVFIDDQKRLGIGRGKRIYSQVLQWLRQHNIQLALITNGFQWRIVFAGLDYEAFCQWDIEQWLIEGEISAEFTGLMVLVSPTLWTPPEKGQEPPLLSAINESRKGQADLSQVLGERVRQAAEVILSAHTSTLNTYRHNLDNQDIYRAAVRMVMRLVVILFAESREGLLPRDNSIYYSAYSLQGLREFLERISPHKLKNSYSAYPRFLALLKLIYHGSSHEALPVTAYGGELFAPGKLDDSDGMKRALYYLENECFQTDLMNDYEMYQILDLLTRTRIKIRQGRSAAWITAPVDFSNLDSEYMGILYEGLLDFELHRASEDEPVIFLAVGKQPALPLSSLEQMDDGAIKNLLEKLNDTSPTEEESEASEEETELSQEIEEEPSEEEEPEQVEVDDQIEVDDPTAGDLRFTLQARAEQWARQACEVGGLVKKPRGRITPEKQMQYEQALNNKAHQLIDKVVLPGEWYLVRWGGNRKGSGTFYTRPQLAIPTAHRTLRPLAYEPPLGHDNKPDTDVPPEQWIPKKPEVILELKVCDPACGSGSFCLAALRFLTTALYKSLLVHNRVREHGGRAVLDLIFNEEGSEALVNESLPCRPDDDDFEPRTKAILRRYVAERCIYGVDIDPLAVELCRLSLWIETLDRNLPLTFLNHKIKTGNSLVGAWFDQFLHYPVMAWEREGGDKSHSNGVHYSKEHWTKSIKKFKALVKEDLINLLDGYTHLAEGKISYPIDINYALNSHSSAEKELNEIHELGITQVEERAEKYNAFRDSADFQKLKSAFDLWCSLWFWPADQIEKAPLPSKFAKGELPAGAVEITTDLTNQHKFFHWEIEFPDVFNEKSAGFDAMLGNPPWDISKPNSKEFFSAIDPLYRSYGKQEAARKQTEYFRLSETIEHHWLKYNAGFKSMSNWVKYVGYPFGDRIITGADGRSHHDFKIGDRGKSSFDTSQYRHERWKNKRKEIKGYVDENHSFRYQGSGDINLYKLFLEQTHLLLKDSGRFGLIVPSGIYSDFGTGELRRLFVEQCSWEWLFGFENRDKIFGIHRSFKFNPVIIAKNAVTEIVNTAFMRRNLADWEQAENFAVGYPRQQIAQFSPESLALLEILSKRDLDVLAKVYSKSVLLGDQSEKGWGIKYTREFDMTNDSKLFPPRPKWEEWGYRPDEYSRWIKGPWKPIEELYSKLGISPLRNGDLRCAQPPYNKLPIPRADIQEGIILSREADAWICEDEMPEVTFTDANENAIKIDVKAYNKNKIKENVSGKAIALPVYNAKMISMFDFSSSGWVKGKGRGAKWSDLCMPKIIEPEYLMGNSLYYASSTSLEYIRILLKDITTAVHYRTTLSAITPCLPAVNAVPILTATNSNYIYMIQSMLGSYCFDYVARRRLGYLHLNYFILKDLPLFILEDLDSTLWFNINNICRRLCLINEYFSPVWVANYENYKQSKWRVIWALSIFEKMRLRCILDAIVSKLYGLDEDDLLHCLAMCDLPLSALSRDTSYNRLTQKGFWRVDKDKHPELRHTVLTIIAFHDLQEKINSSGGDMNKGIEAFCNQNNGEGWMLPETIRLADYSLGHDDRAKEYQPVRECFGPRFYDWQLAQSAEESWRECHLHARNLLGKEGYQRLLDEVEGRKTADQQAYLDEAAESEVEYTQGTIFDN